MKLKIGTRGSKLALWQAYYVADKLQQGGIETEIVKIDTKGDKKLDVTIAEIGEKGVFTLEIEQRLLNGSIDIAVHSAKDMQSELAEEFELIAFTEREKVHDVLVSHQQINIADQSKEWVIGTSSARRKALLKHFYPNVKTVEIRGNLQTRFSKMEAGLCDAMLLAYAGVHRMDFHDKIIHEFDIQEFIPAVGQGSVAVEILSGMENDKKNRIKELVSHQTSETRLRAERSFLKTLRGGCSIPVFALATFDNDILNLKGGVISLDGKELIQEQISGDTADPEALGESLAHKVLESGGDLVLEKIKKQMNIS